jgi:N-acetyl-beta-hexosaminidase
MLSESDKYQLKRMAEKNNVVDQTDKIWGSRPQAKQGETPTYGGFYTQNQIKEIIQYASARNITIVPEIEMPGHVASAIAREVDHPLMSYELKKKK